MVTECLGRYDNMPKHTNGGATNLPPSVDVEGLDLADDDSNVDNNQMADRLQEAQIPLFEGSKNNRLVTTLLLLNCFAIFGVLIAFANELLKLLSEVLLERKTLPKSHYEGRKYLSKLGMTYDSIHTCGNGFCFFRKELKVATKCPKCNESRYTSDSSKRSVKVLCHFPLIPRLKKMFQYHRLAELLKWNATRKKDGNKVECVPDSKAW
jgi:hypothetical protein